MTGTKVLLERLENFALSGPMPEPPHVYSLNFRPLKALPIKFSVRAG